MRRPKCGHSEDSDWKFEQFGEPVISNTVISFPDTCYMFDGTEWIDVSGKPKPTLWQGIKRALGVA